MPEKNNIDKLFQDKLKGLKASPNPNVWAAIENKMAPKKQRIIPFWWFSGIAGILILGFFLFPFSKKQDVIIPNNSLENNFTSTEKETILNNIDTVFSKHLEKENIHVVEKENHQQKKKKTQNYIEEKNVNKTPKQKKEESVKKVAMEEKDLPENLEKEENYENKNKNHHQQKQQTIVSSISTKEQNKNISKTKSSENSTDNKKALLLEENVVSSTKNDKKTRKVWSILTSFAFLNSGSFSNSSPFSENLNNTTKGQNSLGYGIQIGYKINNKWSIRSGVQLQELNYLNNNVRVTSSRNNIAAVNFKGIPEASIQSTAPTSSANSDSFESFNLRTTNTSNGNLSQQFGYIELPVEVKYTLSENAKLQTQLVGGFSSLFLTTNNVLINDAFSNLSGEGSNLNTINFSSNLGIDFNYQFSKQWSFSVNPMLKTFLNTFSDKANNFSPFNLGVYSGIRYQF